MKRVVCDLKGIKVGMMIDRSGVGHGRLEGSILGRKDGMDRKAEW